MEHTTHSQKQPKIHKGKVENLARYRTQPDIQNLLGLDSVNALDSMQLDSKLTLDSVRLDSKLSQILYFTL